MKYSLLRMSNLETEFYKKITQYDPIITIRIHVKLIRKNIELLPAYGNRNVWLTKHFKIATHKHLDFCELEGIHLP